MKTILIAKMSNGYAAHFIENGKPEAAIVAVMGTHIIPTSYTRSAMAQTVVNEIAKLNPDYEVFAV